MCGIAGYKRFGKEAPTLQHMTDLFLEIESRGTDASGYAYISKKGELVVHKAPIRASDFVNTEAWTTLNFRNINTFIMHTRAATKGKPENNGNNHPIFNKNGIALVHNGQIRNDDFLFKKFNYNRDAEVDSEIIIKLIENGWWDDVNAGMLERLYGSYAVAAINANRPDELILFKHQNPINIYADKQKDIIYFASLGKHLEDTFTEFHRGFRVADIRTYALSDDTAYLIDKSGLNTYKDIDAKYKREFDEPAPVVTNYKSKAADKTICVNNVWYTYDEYMKMYDDDKGNTKGKAKKVLGQCDACGESRNPSDLYQIEKNKYCEECLALMTEGSNVYCNFCYNPVTIGELLLEKCDKCNNEIRFDTVVTGKGTA